MKFLKTYENNKIKKYIFFKAPGDLSNYVICEIINKYNKNLNCLKLLYYYSNGQINTPEQNFPILHTPKSFKISKKSILYTSDNLQKCLELLEIFGTSKKYNI